MYVVREKKTKKIVHINPAPLKQGLEGKEIYFGFDAKKMEVGRSDSPLPEHFDISKDGEIFALEDEEKAKAGLIALEPHQKADVGEIAEKTLAEMMKEGLISLDEIRQQKKGHYSALALQQRNEILPDYKIQNALMGIYDEGTAAAYKATVEAFRKEFHRLEGVIDKAASLDEIEKIKARFPKSVAGSSSGTQATPPPDSSKVKPSADPSKVKPSAESSKAEPSPESSKAEPSPESSKAEPSAESSKAEPSAESSKAEPSPESSKAKPPSEPSKAKPSSEPSKAKPSPESSQAKPAPASSKVKPSAELSKVKLSSKPSKIKPSSESSKVKQGPRGKKKKDG